MRPEPEPTPVPSNPSALDQSRESRPYLGGYYWFPTPQGELIVWSVVTCRDLRCGPDDGHDAELWPRLMEPLAKAWGKDAQILKRRLALCYTGLPRGRVTRPERPFLILHGNDSPTPTWQELVTERFRLTSRRSKFLFDEHETQISGHLEALELALGCRIFRQ